MKKNLLYFILLIILSSCGASKVTTEKPTTTVAESKAENTFFHNIDKPVTFDNLKISSKIDVQNGQPIPTLNALFYIEKDKKVWANISAFLGLFGGARALVTPAGIQGYEKINKTYIDSDFSYLNNLLGVDFINLQSLQELLVGKTFVPVNEANYSLTQTAQGFTLTSKQPQTITVDGKQTAYNVALTYDKQFNLTNAAVNKVDSADSLEISYADWTNIKDHELPQNVKIVINNKKTETILIENTNFDFSKMDTPFSIPANYQKKEIK